MTDQKPVFIGRKKLKELGIPFCDMQLRRLEASGLFPKRVKLSPNRIAYLYTEIQAYIQEKTSERDTDDTSP